MARINPTFLSFCRTIHIYLTMLGLFVMLIFSVTGFTVNHEAWFGATTPHVSEAAGQTPLPLIQAKNTVAIVEHIRQSFSITGAMTGLDDLDDRYSIGFKAPGATWEVEIDKPTGKTTVHTESFNSFALVNNLHRGRYSGPAWSWVIDISALLIVLASATGFVLWLALPKRRKLGLAAMLLGTVATILVYLILVPGPDTRIEKPTTTPANTSNP